MPFSCMQNKNNPEGHEGPARRFVQFGGGISAEQLVWFVQQLADARAADQRVIVCGHLPLHPGTCIGTCLLWNYEEVLQVIWDAGNVVATISGHAHNVSLCTPNALFCLSQTSHCNATCTSCSCKDVAFTCNRVWLTHRFIRWCRQLAISCDSWSTLVFCAPYAVLCEAVHVSPARFCLALLCSCTWSRSTLVPKRNAVYECRMGMQLMSMGSTTGF